MPELAEVEYCRSLWDVGLRKKILSIHLHPKTRIFRDTDPSKLQRVLIGDSLKTSLTRGKRLFFSIDKTTHLEIHLGMAGRLASIKRGDYRPTKHDHFLLQTKNAALAFNDYRQFGRILLHHETAPWANLPLEPLDPAFTKNYLANHLERHHRSVLKRFLLDQTIFPGVGNWMADEILWRTRLHPETAVRTVDPSMLHKEVRAVCRGALLHVAEKPLANPSAKLAHHTDTPAWGSPPPSWLFQHRWSKGGICPRSSCASPLRRISVRQRTTCYCPVCQPKKPLRSR